MEVSPICLGDGWLPCVGEAMPPTNEGHLLHIEPAIWFKVLVLDSMSIDCTRRVILWNCNNDGLAGDAVNGESESMSSWRGLTESMYVGGELSGCGAEMEELFSSLEWLVAEYEVGQLPQQRLHEQLLQLLHCYLLPLVTLAPEDLPRVRSELHQQQDRLASMDELILQKNSKMEDVLGAQGRQLDHYVQGLISTDSDDHEHYSLEFAEMLYRDVQKEANCAANRLDFLQEEVEHAKSPSATERPQQQDLLEKRVQRDEGYKKYKDLLVAREELHNIIAKYMEAKRLRRRPSWRSIRSSRRPANPLHDIYAELHRQAAGLRAECTELMERKVLLMSVKEALRVVLNELEAGGTAVRLEQHQGSGQRPTDVLPSGGRGWLSLQEQIARLLDSPRHLVAKQHHDFCSEVRDKCQAALFEKHLSELTPSVPSSQDPNTSRWTASSLPASLPMSPAAPIPAHMSPPLVLDTASQPASVPSMEVPLRSNRESLIQLEGQLGDEDIVILHDTDKNYLKTAIETLKTDIKNHFDDISTKIQSELGHATKSAYKSIWLCYEVHFYEASMPHILQLYSAAYVAICDQLQQCMVRLTAQDLDLDQSIVGTFLQGQSMVMLAPVLEDPPTASPTVGPPLDNDLAQNNYQSRHPQPQAQGKPRASTVPAMEEVVNSSSALPQSRSAMDTTDNSVFVPSSTPVPAVEAVVNGTITSPECSDPTWNPQPTNTLDTEKLPSDVLMYPDECGMPPLNQDSTSSSDSQKGRLTTQRPASMTLLYNRRTWPLLQHRDSLEITEPPSEASSQDSGFVQLQPALLEYFQPALDCLHRARQARVPLHKLQQLTGCLREINRQLSASPEQQGIGTGTGACSDDLIDVLVILLCNWPDRGAAELYPHLMLLADVIPPFFEGGPYSFALVQFSVAFQFLQERLVIKNRITGNASVD